MLGYEEKVQGIEAKGETLLVEKETGCGDQKGKKDATWIELLTLFIKEQSKK